MKKFLLLTLLLTNLFIASAQVCKISGGKDSIEVFSATITDDNNVDVVVSNDSSTENANVTVTIEVIYKNSYGFQLAPVTFSGKGLAIALNTTVIKIPISTSDQNYKPVSVKVNSISGTKCDD